jgi:putative transposase
VAAVLLPDHLHLMLTLPDGDADFSIRVAAIKARFTRRWVAADGDGREQSASRERQGYRGVWQKRFWEHAVRDDDDRIRCLDYIHYNPVKHRLARCPHAWPWSTFARFVRQNDYAPDWHCTCDGRAALKIPTNIPGAEMD